MTNYTDRMKFAQEMMTIAESTIAIVEHFRKLQRDGFHFNITGDYYDNIVLYDSNLAGKFFIKPVPISNPIDLTTRTVYKCRFQEVEKAFFKYINDLKVKMKVFQIKQIGIEEL